MNKTYLLLSFLLCCGWLFGQQGAISGTILDTDGFPLIGANVVVEGTGTGGSADFDGKYTFKIQTGTYTLIASYLGFADKRLVVTVEPNETVILDIIMEEGGAVDINEVLVVESRINNSENAVLAIRRGSDKVQDLISSQELSRLGAGNAAAALTKVTGTTVVDGKYVYVRGLGDRYSATTLNGLRLIGTDPYLNGANLSLIPSSIVENIAASKTFTPDLPGDFTGGSVNINLKSLPERFTYGVSVTTSYNQQANFRNDFLSFDAGDGAKFGFNDGTLDRPEILTSRGSDILFTDVARQAERDDDLANLVDDVANSFPTRFSTPEPTSSGLDYSISANVGTQLEFGKTRVGLFATGSFSKSYFQYNNGTTANWELSPGEDVLFELFDFVDNRSVESPELNGMVGLTVKPGNNNKISFYSILSRQTDIEGRDLQGSVGENGIGGDSFFKSQVSWFRARQMANHVLSGEHRIGGSGDKRGLKLDWAFNLVDTKQEEPDIQFFAYIFDNIFQINRSIILGPQRFYRNLEDDFYQGKIDLTIPILQSSSRSSSIKVGGFYSRKDREFEELAYEYQQRRGTTLNDAMADPSVFFGEDNLGLIGVNEANGRNIIGQYIVDVSNLSNSYVGGLRDIPTLEDGETLDPILAGAPPGGTVISAAYAMTTLELSDRFKAILGARLETTDMFVASRRALQNASDSMEVFEETASIDEANILPALNLVYQVTPNSNLRFGYSTTLARPSIREIAPFGSFGFIGDPITFGNPQLNITTIDNFDLRFEHFPEDRSGEVIAVSAFYKDFTDPIVRTFRLGGDVQQFTWTNSESANLFGIELELRKRLDFISPLLSNFTFNSNFAYIQSEQTIDSLEFVFIQSIDSTRSNTREFSGQSDFVANFNLTYSLQEVGFEATVAYNYFSDRLFSIGSIGAPDIFERGRATLDFLVSQEIGHLKLSFRARNLINPNFETFSEFEGETYLFNSFQRGRNFSVGISYQL
ncbi:MAG: TonB-dependent receptor [Bacteroidota bacterium]